jgi:hypothetical protein
LRIDRVGALALAPRQVDSQLSEYTTAGLKNPKLQLPRSPAKGVEPRPPPVKDELESGKVVAVGLDVCEKEPVTNERPIKNENALLVPHLGTHRFETLAKMETCAMENARRAVLELPFVGSPHLCVSVHVLGYGDSPR